MSPNVGLLAFLVVLGSSITHAASKVCPLQGPAFPLPQLQDETVQKAWKTFDNAFTTAIETGNSEFGSTVFNETSYSIAVFSSSSGPIYERHFTDRHVRNSSAGTHTVDSNSIYRLGSIGKLLTVYLWLLQEGQQHFSDPITKYIPELAEVARASDFGNGVTASWTDITIGELASHSAGLSRSYGLYDQSYPWINELGLPPLNPDDVPSCGYFDSEGKVKPCTSEEIVDGMAKQPVLFQSSSSPIYSDEGFILMGLALERVTNSTLEDLFAQRIVEAHGLDGTSFSTPNSTERGVIPIGESSALWDNDLGASSAAGGYFSTTNDMVKLGKAILTNKFLSPAETRRWIKPVSFTSSKNLLVGAAWEIFRVEVANHTVDVYTKNGGLGAYATIFGLVPDYGVGFSILTASAGGETVGSPLVWFTSEMLLSALLPGLEAAARERASSLFAGSYTSSNLNSSLGLAVDDQPGLRVTNWISNGTDMLTSKILAGGSLVEGQYVDFRIQPNQLYEVSDSKVGFTGVWQVLPTSSFSSPLDLSCMTWGGVNVVTHGNVGIEQFVFDIDERSGRAVSVQPMALRIALDKVEN